MNCSSVIIAAVFVGASTFLAGCASMDTAVTIKPVASANKPTQAPSSDIQKILASGGLDTNNPNAPVTDGKSQLLGHQLAPSDTLQAYSAPQPLTRPGVGTPIPSKIASTQTAMGVTPDLSPLPAVPVTPVTTSGLPRSVADGFLPLPPSNEQVMVINHPSQDVARQPDRPEIVQKPVEPKVSPESSSTAAATDWKPIVKRF